jgi:hypothetical protein
MTPFFGKWDDNEDKNTVEPKEPSQPRKHVNMSEKDFRVSVLKGLVAIEHAIRTGNRHYWASDMEMAVRMAQSMREDDGNEQGS